MSNNPERKTVTVDISLILIVKILLVLLTAIFLYLIRDIILILFIAVIVSSAIIPWVDDLERKKIPRFLSIVFIYLMIFGLLSAIIILIVPPITNQLGQLATNLPYYYNETLKWFGDVRGVSLESMTGFQQILQKGGEGLASGVRGIFSILGTIFGGLLGFIIALVITFYITLQKDSTKKFLQSVTPIKYQPYIIQLSRRIQEKMGAWLKGQLLLSLIVGLLCYIGLTALGVKYALILGIIAGVTEVIPYLGPWLGAIPAVILAFVQSPIVALFVVILYIVVQQIENHIIVPQVMKRAVGLNPIIIIIAIAVGSKLAGIGGAIIAIPLVAAISIVARDLFELKRDKETV